MAISTPPISEPTAPAVAAAHSPRRPWVRLRQVFAALLVLAVPVLADQVSIAAALPGNRRLPADDPVPEGVRRNPPILRVRSRVYTSYVLFLDPDPYVVTKEFAFYYNTVPAPDRGPGKLRGLFHLIYQRSSGPQRAETLFGHAWSEDLRNWAVDTSAFAVDKTGWNSAHVWSPCLVRHGAKDYLFYTGVDSLGDQRIGYASTDLLDTTNTEWDPQRVKVWEASDTRWAVPDPWTYGDYMQFRDPFVMEDPVDSRRLLLYYSAHDSSAFLAGKGGLVVGVARSDSGTVDRWRDLGYYASTLTSTTRVGQLEGPHLVPLPGTNAGWKMLFSNAGTPPGEAGESTIQFEQLVPGASVSDTSRGNWGAPKVLTQYLKGDPTVFGWSGSEHLRVGQADFLAGFTAWGPFLQGIAIARMNWQGNDFTLGGSVVTAVDEVQSAAKDLRMSVVTGTVPTQQVKFVIESPRELDARLEVFDAMGRRLVTLLAGKLPSGRSSASWDLKVSDGGPVPAGVYFARLAFAGGNRSVRIPVVR